MQPNTFGKYLGNDVKVAERKWCHFKRGVIIRSIYNFSWHNMGDEGREKKKLRNIYIASYCELDIIIILISYIFFRH